MSKPQWKTLPPPLRKAFAQGKEDRKRGRPATANPYGVVGTKDNPLHPEDVASNWYFGWEAYDKYVRHGSFCEKCGGKAIKDIKVGEKIWDKDPDPQRSYGQRCIRRHCLACGHHWEVTHSLRIA